MSQQNPIRVFVTHNWHDSDDYSRVFEYLESAKNFFYRNTSTPDIPPGATDTESVRANLRKQIDAAEVVVALVTLYTDSPDLLVWKDAREAHWRSMENVLFPVLLRTISRAARRADAFDTRWHDG